MKIATGAAAVLLATTALAQAEISNGVVRIGVLTDLSGPYSDFSGPTSVEAARLAVLLPAPKLYERRLQSGYLNSRTQTILARMEAVQIP